MPLFCIVCTSTITTLPRQRNKNATTATSAGDCAGIAVAAQQRRQYCRKTAEQKKPNQDELYPAVCTHVASFSNLALRRLTGRGLLLPTPIAKNRNTIWYS